jgi:hypothetical protein
VLLASERLERKRVRHHRLETETPDSNGRSNTAGAGKTTPSTPDRHTVQPRKPREAAHEL